MAALYFGRILDGKIEEWLAVTEDGRPVKPGRGAPASAARRLEDDPKDERAGVL